MYIYDTISYKICRDVHEAFWAETEALMQRDWDIRDFSRGETEAQCASRRSRDRGHIPGNLIE